MAALGQLKPDTFPSYQDNYTKTIVQPCTDQGGTIEGFSCVLPPPPPPEPVYAPEPVLEAPAASQVIFGSLTGSLGYTSPMSNCVDFVKQFRQVPFGNPISWIPTTQVPFIGAVVLFPYNHVGYLVGIHNDGSIEVAHANCPGCNTRFSPSEVRGYF